MDGQGWTLNFQLFAKTNPEKPSEARCSALTHLSDQFAIVKKMPAGHIKYAEHVLAIRDWKENVVP